MESPQARSGNQHSIVLYESGQGWQCQHTFTDPPWEGAILLCKECEYQAMDGAQLIDQNGKPVPWDESHGHNQG
jgi:hypothetical protein